MKKARSWFLLRYCSLFIIHIRIYCLSSFYFPYFSKGKANHSSELHSFIVLYLLCVQCRKSKMSRQTLWEVWNQTSLRHCSPVLCSMFKISTNNLTMANLLHHPLPPLKSRRILHPKKKKKNHYHSNPTQSLQIKEKLRSRFSGQFQFFKGQI